MTNTKTIARNSGWFGLETVTSAVVSLVTSILVNRYLGPQKNGYLVWVSYISGLVGCLGGAGIGATTRKYMAEFIGMGDWGTARYIYIRTLLLQTGIATLVTSGILYWFLRDANAEYRLAAALMVLSIWPSMVNSPSSQANAATEDLSKNIPASVISSIAYLLTVAATVFLHWGVTGIGAAMFVQRAIDFLVRFFPTMKRVLAWKTPRPHPPGLRARMVNFAMQAVASMTVTQVVWGRSEIILLKKFCPDISQVTYYSLAFTMSDLLLLAASIFGSAVGVTMFAQYGRDKSKLPEFTATAFRCLALMSIPMHFIAASLAVPALLLVYGHKFTGAAAVVALAPLLCMFKAFAGPAQSLMESAEKQRYVIAATVMAGIVDIGVAWYLIPAHAAVGACIGNGAAQLTAVGLMWAVSIHLYKVKLPWMLVGKVAFCSLLASLTAHYIAVRLAPAWAIACGGSAALIVLFSLFYLLRVLEPEDHLRLRVITGILPKPVAGLADLALSYLIRIEPGSLNPKRSQR